VWTRVFDVLIFTAESRVVVTARLPVARAPTTTNQVASACLPAAEWQP
jgi:hypothetical protein